MPIFRSTLAAAVLATLSPLATNAQSGRPVVAVFAHADDERVIAPLLAKLAREKRETHLVIATDGAKGIRDFANIPAGAELAAARAKEASCAANRLGVRQLHLLGLPDGGLASFDALGKLRSALVAVIDSLNPAEIITFGPEGGTGHPDHRLVGDVMTEIVQRDERHARVDLLYVSLPTERLRTAPPARPGVTGMAASLLTVRLPFEEQDLAAQREAFACHRTQYTPAEMEAVNAYLAHAFNGVVWLRPWNGTPRNAPAAAQTSTAAIQAWHGSVGAGLANTSGNANTRSWNLAFKTVRNAKKGTVFAADGMMIRGSKDGTLNVDNSLFRTRLDVKYANRAFVFAQAQFLRNPFKSIDYFWATTVGLSHRLLDSSAGSFSVDLSGGASWERNVNRPAKTHSAVAFGEKFSRALSKTATFTHAFAGNVVASDVGDGLYTTSVGVAAAVTNRTQVKVEVLDTYRTATPTAAINKRDLSTVVSFGYKF